MYNLAFRMQPSVFGFLLDSDEMLCIMDISCALFLIEKCRLFWSEVENFCRTFILFENLLYVMLATSLHLSVIRWALFPVIKWDFLVPGKGNFLFFLKSLVGPTYFLMRCGRGFEVCYYECGYILNVVY